MGRRKTSPAKGITLLANGQYRVRVTLTDPRTGKRVDAQETLPPGTTLGQAIDARATVRSKALAERTNPRTAATLTVYARHWLATKAKRWRRSTIQERLRMLEQKILPHLGHLRLEEIRRVDIEQWVIWAEQTGRARETVQKWWTVLCQLVRDACADHGLPDPTARIRPPRPPHGTRMQTREKRTLTADELGQLLAKVQELASLQRYTEVATLAWTGMRPGELIALQWEDLNVGRRTLTIQRTRNKGETTNTKTDDPRVVPVSAPLLEALELWRRHMVATQNPGLSSGLIFPSERSAQAVHRSRFALARSMRVAGEKAKLEVRVTPQVLRRTFNTLLMNAGVDRVVLRSIMGHCSEAMTERYAGVGVEAKLKATEQLLKRG